MKSNLQKYMAAEGISQEEYEEGDKLTDGETELDVHVSSEPSVDAEVAAVAEAELEQDEIEDDVDALVEAQESMEAYVELLEVAADNGGITPQAANFMRLGLERYEEMFGLEEPLTPSVEAFGGSASQLRSTTVSLEGLKETLKTAWEQIKRALAALWSAIQDVFAKATDAGGRIQKEAKALSSKASQVKPEDKSSDKVTIKNAKSLYADGKYMGDNPAIVAGFASMINDTYVKAAVAVAEDYAKALRGADPADVNAVIALAAKDDQLGKITAVLKKVEDKRFGSGADVYRSDILPGNTALYVAKGENKLRAEMAPVPEAKAGESEHELSVGSPTQLKTTLAEIEKAAGLIARSKDTSNAIKGAIDDLIKAGDEFKAKVDKADDDKVKKDQVSKALRNVTVIQKLLGTTVTGATSTCARILNAQMAVVKKQLAAYGGKKDDKEDKGGDDKKQVEDKSDD